MKNFHKQDGFTLVEMLVTVVIGTVITAAAVTVLLLGLRVNKQSTDTVSRQNTTRILLSALESMATEGSIKKVEMNGAESWKIVNNDDEDSVAFSYLAETQTIYTGLYPDNEEETPEGTPLLEGVYSSFVSLDNKQITITVETEEGNYSSTVYCRLMGTSRRTEIENDTTAGNLTDNDSDNDDVIADNIDADEETARTEFLRILANQYKGTGSAANLGWIIDQNGNGTATYYAQWYNSEWPMKTPWCACFISWGLYESMGEGPQGHENWFANVDTFMEYFQDTTTAGSWKKSEYYSSDDTKYIPIPGDIVFFDWIVNGQDNPQHAGVVLSVDTTRNVIRTIEGNTSGMVAIREYPLNDSCILGYGVLNWKQQ